MEINKLINDSGTSFFMGLAIFCGLFYVIWGFQFGIVNNLEELPLLYKMQGEGNYNQDVFVQYHTSHYTQITPFLTILNVLLYIFGIQSIEILFFILHLLTISLLYRVFYLITRDCFNFKPIESSLFLIGIIWITRNIPTIPAYRWIIVPYFDLELVTIVLIMAIFYFQINGKLLMTAGLLLVTTLIYPIYTIPIYPALLIHLWVMGVNKDIKKFLKNTSLYTLLPAAYTIFLWFSSRKSIISDIDPSEIMQYIRAPWHYEIPSVNYSDQWFWGFTMLSIIVIIAIAGSKFHHRNIKIKGLFLIYGSMLSILAITSVVHSMVRIPLLVQIAPYRIGLFCTLIGLMLLFAFFKEKMNLRIVDIPNVILGIATMLLLSFAIVSLTRTEIQSKEEVAEFQLAEWINTNTSEDHLFLNYTEFDVRTKSYRSEYFNFRSIPLVADQQINWYKRYLAYNALPADTKPLELRQMFADVKWRARHTATIAQVNLRNKNKALSLGFIEKPIAHIIVTVSDLFEHNDYILTYENSHYKVYRKININQSKKQ